MIEQWDYIVRVIGIGASLMLIAQLSAGEVRSQVKLPALGMIVGVVAYLMNSTPFILPAGPIDPWIDLPSLSVPFWIWLFARNLFEREPPLRVTLVVALTLVAAWFVSNFMTLPVRLGFYVIHFVSLGLIVDLARVAFRGRDDDLVEQRRVIRVWLPLLVAAQAGTVLIAELISAPADPPATMRLFHAVMIFALTVFAGLALLRTEPELLLQSAREEPAPDALELPEMSPSEAVLHEKLTAVMNEGLYREPGLSIAGLADRLDTPEHRLRALINQKLGYRNFSAFLNRHRIAEAREKLVEKESVDLPVLTIAMDLGYNSLPTFNRAFRTETGTTPSEFRRLGLSGASVQN
ncbi:MAG: helix-turn-helix domain-containing protein [Erythrobacter sp.]